MHRIAPRSARLAAVALAALGIIGATGCIDGLKPARERTGYISLTVYRDSAGNQGMRPVAAFYKADGLTFPGFTTDTCYYAYFNPNPPLVGGLQTLEAGEFLITNVSGRTDTLDLNSSFGLLLYELRDFPFIPFNTGDTLDLTIPGMLGGFPAAQMSVKTAEAFTFTFPDTASRNIAMPLTWTAPPAPGARMYISLRYGSSNVATVPDEQYFCDVADDGSHTIPALAADVFRNSPYEARSIFLSRARSSTLVIDDITRAYLLSTYDQPLSVYTPP
jgi:hypothetical protein